MKKILIFIALLASVIARAQVSTVSLQAGGLTCSMCSNAINKSLKTLDFIQDVYADIKTYTFIISFRPGIDIDFDKIKNKVESAGFTVNAFVATIYFENVQVTESQPVIMQDKTLLFQQVTEQVLDGEKKVRLLDKGFVSAKEFKRNLFPASPAHTYHVSL